jgi:hypothetical protein
MLLQNAVKLLKVNHTGHSSRHVWIVPTLLENVTNAHGEVEDQATM